MLAASATGLALGSATVSGRQEQVAETFTLAMTQDGWVGQSPSSIQGQSAPTLGLQSGETYRIEWTNRTSNRHNLVVTKGYPGGTPVVRSNYLRQQGQSTSVTFTAESGLAAYFCEDHIGEKGNIAVDGVTATPFEPKTVTPDVNAEQPLQTFRFAARTGGWIALSSGAFNPTLQLVPGRPYAVQWVNADGAPHNFVIEDDDDNFIVRSDYTFEAGATQTLKFVASEKMHEYFCEVHPVKMRGDVQLVSEAEAAQQGNATANGTANVTNGTLNATNGTLNVTNGTANVTGNVTTNGSAGAVRSGGSLDGDLSSAVGALTALGGVAGAGHLFASGGDGTEEERER